MGKTTRYPWVLLLLAVPVSAGVEVTPEAARSGSYGLRAAVEPACSGEETILVVGPVMTAQEVEACKEVVVGAEVRAEGELLATAGQRVVFTSGFSVATGGRLVAGTTGAWNPSYVVDETPVAEGELHVRWHARFDDVGLAPGERMTVLRLLSTGVERGWVRYEADVDGGAVWAEVRGDDGGLHAGEPIGLGSGWHRLELEWRAGSVLARDGVARVRVDGESWRGPTDVPLGGALVDAVELGAMEADGLGGALDLDDYATARSGPLDR